MGTFFTFKASTKMPTRSTTRLTKKLIDQLQPYSSIWDSEVRGFGVRRQKTDRTYVLKCVANGRQKFLTIGRHGAPWTVEAARAEARAKLVQVYKGEDPSNGRGQPSVGDLCDRYLAEHAPKKKPSSAKSDLRLIENHVRPLLGSRFIKEIKKSDIEQFHKEVAQGKTAPTNPDDVRRKQKGGVVVRGGRGVANRALTLLSKMFNLAEDWQLRSQNSNPVSRVKRFAEGRRERFLTTDELARIGVKLTSMSKTEFFSAAAIRFLILTGARLGEALSLRWEWVDLERSLLLLPDSKTGQKTIRLSSACAELLKSMPRVSANPYVFVGQKAGRPLVNLQKPWRRLCRAIGITGVRLHDLRHTYASVSVGLGFSLPITGALLGHASGQTTERYAHLQQDHVSTASQSIGRALNSMLGAEEK